MFPSLTKKQQLLELIYEKYGLTLDEKDITITNMSFGAGGTVTVEFAIPNEVSGLYYLTEPFELTYTRCELSSAFKDCPATVVGTPGEKMSAILTRLFDKYGIALDAAVFPTETLNETVSLDEGPETHIVSLAADASDLWYGDLSITVSSDSIVFTTPATNPTEVYAKGVNQIIPFDLIANKPLKNISLVAMPATNNPSYASVDEQFTYVTSDATSATYRTQVGIPANAKMKAGEIIAFDVYYNHPDGMQDYVMQGKLTVTSAPTDPGGDIDPTDPVM